ncbi:MAG TPA: phosphate acyltransferase PlsX [Anaerolineales bacterium]|nr:phosphate acyltransferase PlsX [Anaerolineales bacterium]
MIRIALDAMGSDNYPTPDVIGGVLAAREYGVEVILVGDKEKIEPVLKQQELGSGVVRIMHAPEMLGMHDKGEALVFKARHKDSKNSMAVGMDMVKNGEADAFVTAGNTGAAWVTALFRLGRLRGVSKPALAVIFPTAKGHCVVLDIGANPDCEPENLVQFAKMGSIYAEKVRGVANPRVGIISNGEEEGKGNLLVRETSILLKQADLNFVGNIEGKEMIGGHVDVAVTDGFTGNVVLKTSEAIAKFIMDSMKTSILNGNIMVKLGGMLIKPALKKLKNLMDPSEEGAAPLLGVNGLVFIGHGRSDDQAIKNAVRIAKEAVESNVLESIKEKIH